MLKTILVALLPSLLFFSSGSDRLLTGLTKKSQDGSSGTLEKMIVANGSVAMDIDLGRLNGSKSRARNTTLRFAVAPDAFYKIHVFNDEFRGALPGSMPLTPQTSATLPSALSASYEQL